MFQRFLRTVTGLIARHVTGARKGRPFGRRFWSHVAFTRVVTGLRGFKQMRSYVEKNRVEAEFGALERRLFESFEQRVREMRQYARGGESASQLIG